MDLSGSKSYAQGRFLVQSTLGTGSMGIVYDALDTERNLRVALKTLLRMDSDSLYYFKKEFRSLHDLVHPNLCSFIELINDDDVWFFTMELVDGVDFLSYITKPHIQSASDSIAADEKSQLESRMLNAGRKKSLGPKKTKKNQHHLFDEGRLRKSLAGLCEGINALHSAGKIHRDVKPSNVMVTEEGRVVLLDFGLAVEKETPKQSRHSGIVGTVAYMAPEQASSDRVGPEVDWYAAGSMLYVALTGKLPFAGEPIQVIFNKQNYDPKRPRLVNPEVPEDLDCLCMDLLQRDPDSRPAPTDILDIVRVETKVQYLSEAPRTTSIVAEEIPFVGRGEELQLLWKALEQSAEGFFDSVIIEGVSGVGKSALVDRFTGRAISEDSSTMILRGHCYEHESAPFKAFDGVIDSFINHLRQISEKEAARFKPRHADLLVRLFPALMRSDLFFDTPAPVAGAEDPQELQSRAFDAFLEVLFQLSHRYPLIVVIDDVQWADSDSLLLIRHLVQNSDTLPLLLILSSRFAKNAADSVLAWDELIARKHRRIHLRPLCTEDSIELARRCINQEKVALNVDPKSIAVEASGHPLYIAELVHHIGRGAEDWKSLRLEDVIWKRVETLPDKARGLLETVCVAGMPIERRHLQSISQLSAEDFFRSISVLRASNLIRSRGPRGNHLIEPYHDRVREAVATHSPLRDRAAELHLKIGRLLCDAYSADELDENIYAVTRHLNEGKSRIVFPEERRRLCELNLSAGNKAKRASAYILALDYFKKGIALIGNEAGDAAQENQWQSDYSLSLELHTKVAETGFLLDDQQLMNTHCQMVINNSRDLLDQVTVYEIMIQEAEARSDVKNGVSIALDILKQLGVDLPLRPSKFRVVMELLKTKKLLKGCEKNDILGAPEMSDPYAKAIVQISHRSSAIMYFISKNLMAVNVFVRLRLCLRYGNTPASICAFASYAIICCGILRKFEEGYKYGKLSLALLSKYNIDEYRGAALFRFNSFIRFWKEPLGNALAPLKESYHCCVDVGDFSTAAYPAFNYAYIAFLVGAPMQDYLPDTDDFIKGLRKIGEQNGLRILLSFRQFADNVINKQTDQGKMEGPYYNEEEGIPTHLKEDNRTGLYTVYFMKMILSFLFGEYDDARVHGKQCREYLDGVVSTYIESLFYFYDSLIWMAAWEDLAGKEKAEAKKSIRSNLKLLDKFNESCEENFLCKNLLVQAEWARIKGKGSEACELYQDAIDSALENNFANEAAIAFESFARFSLMRRDEKLAKVLISKAGEYFESWGAHAKVEQLKKKYSRLLAT